ncbi:hypothetical protein MXB_1176 [Myxobolus squamalis]|nr:hypothetical protein MXB_1176 [Myxobolus squamalis]
MVDVPQINSGQSQYQDLMPYGPSDWSKYYPHCGSSKQSPISIMRNITEKSKKWHTNLNLVIPTGGEILQGVLENDGNMVQFYFYNDEYLSFESAVNKSDGLVVLGFLIGFGYHGNYGIIKLNQLINNITEAHTSVNIGRSISIYDIISQGWEKDLFYSYYQGSLTTPPCYESVTWIIASDALKVRIADLKPWISLKGDKVELICNNNRPVQNLNQRKVYSVED